MKMLKNKVLKGSTHIGFILSFVMFVSAIIFIYVLLQPSLSKDVGKENLLNLLENRLIENTSSYVQRASITTSSSGEQCFLFTDFLIKTDMSKNLTIKGEDILTSYVSSDGNSLYIDRGSSPDVFFRVFYSKEFPQIEIYTDQCGSDLKTIDENDYKIGFAKNESYVLETLILKAIQRYNSDYNEYKKEIGFPVSGEFSFGFISADSKIVEVNGNEPDARSIYAREIPIIYIDNNANKSSGYFRLKVW